MTMLPASVESRTLQLSISGLRIMVQVKGSGDPVLMLNGLSRPMASWLTLASALINRTVITFDAPGVGASATPLLPYSMPMLSRLATQVLDALKVNCADVVGFSHGGAVAQQLAADHPMRVRRLVLLSTSCGVGSIPGRMPSLARKGLQLNDGTPWSTIDPFGLLWQIAAISTWSSIPILGLIEAPTLVISGSRDKIVPPLNSRLLAARIRDANLVMIDAGHDLQGLRTADTVAPLVEQFLARSFTSID